MTGRLCAANVINIAMVLVILVVILLVVITGVPTLYIKYNSFSKCCDYVNVFVVEIMRRLPVIFTSKNKNRISI